MNNTKIIRTKKYIQESLLILLKNRDLKHITIMELCEKAGVHRSTFYNHYGSQYEVFNDIESEYMSEIEKYMSSTDAFSVESLKKRVVLAMEYMKKNLDLTKLLMKYNDTNKFFNKIVSTPQLQKLLKLHMSKDNIQIEAIYFIVAGSSALVKKWIEDGCVIEAEQESNIILNLAQNTAQNL